MRCESSQLVGWLLRFDGLSGEILASRGLVPTNVRTLAGLTRRDKAELSGRLAAGAVSIGAFERSRWRLRRTRSELWDFDLPLLVVARRCRNEASPRKPLGCICTMKWGPAGCPRGQDLRVDGGE